MRFEARNILVTGGAGFIGCHLVRALLERGHAVVNLDKLTYAGNIANLTDLAPSPRYRFVQGDICDQSLVGELMRETRPDIVFNLAAESHVDRSISGPADFIRTNIAGTFTLLEEAVEAWRDYPDEMKSRFRFIQVSTDEVFGDLDDSGKFSENTAYNPSSPYSASKAGADHLARAWKRTFGLPVTITNCSNNYGPAQHSEKLIPTIIRSAVNGDPIPLFGNGTNVRDWIFVLDHVQGLIQAAERGAAGQTYLFGGGEERRNKDICTAICTMLDRLKPLRSGRRYAEQIAFVADRPGHDKRYAIDFRTTTDRLGWQPAVTLDSGLMQTVEWYLAHPERRATSAASTCNPVAAMPNPVEGRIA